MNAAPSDDQLHILVIDDDADIRRLFEHILLAEGHQVFTVGSAEEGLALLPYDTFQVAFVDHNLPGMEGLIFGEYLRKNNPHMTIALVTGDDDPKLAQSAHDYDIVFLEKPFGPDRVHALVSSYREDAGRRRRERQARDDPDFDLPLAAHFAELPQIFDLPNVPARLEERLVREAKRRLNHLRSVSRYNERDRVVAFSALLALQVLGVKIPKGSSGEPLTAEYDAAMREHGRKAAFED